MCVNLVKDNDVITKTLLSLKSLSGLFSSSKSSKVVRLRQIKHHPYAKEVSSLSFRKKIRLGIGAIAWTNPGIPWFPDLYTGEQILIEMSELGYEGTEMNHKFPKDPSQLRKLLRRRGLVLTSQFKSVLFSDRSVADAERKAFQQHADFLSEMGCEYVIVCEMGGSMHWDPRNPDAGKVTPLTQAQWQSLIDQLHYAGEYCRENGMRLLYHFHAGTVIEQKEEIDELMHRTQKDLVYLLHDTGHAIYGNYDPLELLNRYRERIPYFHLKDVRFKVLESVREEKLDFKQSVDRGLFTVPGDGDIDFESIFSTLYDHESDFNFWLIVEAEQNPLKANPYQYAKFAKQYIENLIKSLEKEPEN